MRAEVVEDFALTNSRYQVKCTVSLHAIMQGSINIFRQISLVPNVILIRVLDILLYAESDA